LISHLLRGPLYPFAGLHFSKEVFPPLNKDLIGHDLGEEFSFLVPQSPSFLPDADIRHGLIQAFISRFGTAYDERLV